VPNLEKAMSRSRPYLHLDFRGSGEVIAVEPQREGPASLLLSFGHIPIYVKAVRLTGSQEQPPGAIGLGQLEFAALRRPRGRDWANGILLGRERHVQV
jgi:hypothetical protein